MSGLMQLVESHNQQGTGQGADWGNLSQMVGHYNAAQSSGGGVQDFQNKCVRKHKATSILTEALQCCPYCLTPQCLVIWRLTAVARLHICERGETYALTLHEVRTR